MRINIFYLSGFMASGKSTLGPILANTIGWNFVDLDNEIERREKRKIVEIFKEEGEEYFRQKETEVLNEFSKKKRIIISLGGGTLDNPGNRQLVKNTGKLIYLKSSTEALYRRLKHKRDRPVLLQNEDEEKLEKALMQKIKSLIDQRMEYYKSADYTFGTDEESIGVTVDKIAKLINKIASK